MSPRAPAGPRGEHGRTRSRLPRRAAATALRHVRVPFRVPFATAAGAWTVRESWIVVLEDRAGRTGVGEAVEPSGAPLDAALDAARIDLAGTPPELLAPGGDGVAVNATIAAASPEAAAAATRAALAAGFRTVKAKAPPGADPGRVAELVAAIREVGGPRLEIRVDANGTWTLEEATAILAALEPERPAYVEQPLAPGEPGPLAELRRRSAVGIAADEGVASFAAAVELLDAGAVDALVVKPARVGGIAATLRIGATAAEHGVPVVVSTLFETGIGLAAALRAAALLPDLPGSRAADRAHGLATAGLLADDLLVEPLLLAGGRLRPPCGPGSGGLGVALDPDALRRFEVAA